MNEFVAASGERYRVAGPAVTGGFASVVPVEDRAGSRYALKHLRWSVFPPDLVLNEAGRLRELDHPNVIRYHDEGTDPVAFVVTELATSGTLQDRLDEARGRVDDLPLATVVDWAGRLLAALAAVHTRLVHRDVTPGNVLFVGPVPKLGDFGSALPLGAPGPATAFATAPLYTPPEGWMAGRGAPASGPAYDLYSLGVVLYQLLTLQPPFLGSREEVRLQHLLRPAPPPSRLRPGMPEAVDRLVLRLLEKDPARRGPDADHCRREVEGLAAMLVTPPSGP